MAKSSNQETILMDMDTHNVNRFLLKPTLEYDNPIQSMMNIYYFEEGVQDKITLTHLNKPKNTLQPGSNCKEWNPTVKFGLTSRTLEVCDYELNGEQCADEWGKGCLRNLQGVGNNRYNMDASPELNAVQMAQLIQLRKGLGDDIFKVAFFSDPDFSTNNYGFEIDLSSYDPEERENLELMMRNCKGWWYDIVNLVENGKMKYLDSNDGTASGNAVLPANVVPFFQDLIRNSTNILKFWNRNRPISERPVILVQSDIFNAYEEYLRSTQNYLAYQFIFDGAAIPGILTFNGYPVIEMPEFVMWDTEIGSIQTTGDFAGYSKYQRAIFTAQENLAGAIDARPLESGQDTSIIIQKSPLVKDKGIVWYLMASRMGFKVTHPELMTVAYNSETNFVAA